MERQNRSKKGIWIAIIIAVAVAIGIFGRGNKQAMPVEEKVDNTKADLIILESPKVGSEIVSPVTLAGEARGNWYFEASFPISIVDWNGQIIGEGHAEAQRDWMTTEFVPFKATVTFNKTKIQNNYSNKGTIILKKDNPSGLPEKDDALEVPVIFK